MTLNRYLVLVGALGVALLVHLAATGGWLLSEMSLVHWALFVFLVIGELMPIRLSGSDDEVTTSSAFSFALLVILGLAPAAAAQAVASLLADIRLRKSWRSTLFNLGQYTISLAAAGATLSALSDLPRNVAAAPMRLDELGVLALSGLVFFALNNTLAGAAFALLERTSILDHLRHDLAFQAWTAALVLGFSPLVVATATYDALLLPFVLLPLLAIYRAGRDGRRSEHQALHDGLTGLPNRTLFRRRTDTAIHAAQADGHGVGVLIIDLDRFKEINDTLGHAYGDLVLKLLAERLRNALRSGDLVARLGGDEFAALIVAIDHPSIVDELAQRLLDAAREPFLVNGITLTLGASIGIATSPAHGTDVDVLLQRADVAMYNAKRRYGGIQAYDEADDHNTLERLSLAVEIRDAVRRDELILHFQPQVNLLTGTVIAAEALMRWQHPTRGLVAPDAFIPVAENIGAMHDMTRFALGAALKECRRWRALDIDAAVTVNVTAQDVLDQQLPEAIARMLTHTGVPASALELELTETMLMSDPDRAGDVLRALSAMNVRVAIDDFGTGYSSLAYLGRLPIEKIKIDKGFVLAMLEDRNQAAIVASTIDLARNLNLRVIAEGVEHRWIADELIAMGCTLGQGYAFARPLPADEFIEWALTATDARPTAPHIAMPLAIGTGAR